MDIYRFLVLEWYRKDRRNRMAWKLVIHAHSECLRCHSSLQLEPRLGFNVRNLANTTITADGFVESLVNEFVEMIIEKLQDVKIHVGEEMEGFPRVIL